MLAHELTVLLSAHGGQLAINKIVPEYKEKFGKNFNCSQFGFTKLIRALEAIPDTIKVSSVRELSLNITIKSCGCVS